MLVFHGTPQPNAPEIMKNGLLRKYSKWKPKRVFVSLDFNAAMWYGGWNDVALRKLTPAINDLLGKSYNVYVAVFAFEVERAELHVDRNLENKWWQSSLKDAVHFYVLRDVFSKEFIGVTNVKTSVGFTYD